MVSNKNGCKKHDSTNDSEGKHNYDSGWTANLLNEEALGRSTVGFARIPEKIANKVYANRLGNGDESSGDGWKFRGRGLIQITGKNNYKLFSKTTNQDFLIAPEKVATPAYALSSACWFWKRKNINQYADQDDVHMVTKAVNGGFNGLLSREHFLQEFKTAYHLQTS